VVRLAGSKKRQPGAKAARCKIYIVIVFIYFILNSGQEVTSARPERSGSSALPVA
jgi:hypothetical protein